MATGPKIALTPLELLENDGTRVPPVFSRVKILVPLAFGAIGFLSVMGSNRLMRRPALSGIQRHIVLSALCAGAAKLADDYRDQYMADRDAVLRHYVELHPEDFPPFERKKFSEVLEPWFPIR